MKTFKSFSRYISEATSEITFTWGRMNPPQLGHLKLMDAMKTVASGNNYRVYLSQSQDKKKNPLDYESKVKYARKMFPRHARSIILDKSIKSIFDVLVQLYDQGYTQVNLVVGSDRVAEFEKLTSKYNGVDARHGFYNFEGGVNVISAGDRDPDAEDVSGMSASKMRAAAADNDFQTFVKGVPEGFSEAKQLFNDVRKGMGLSESHDFRAQVQLSPVSEKRERYVRGNLFSKGDEVIINESDEVGMISYLGANYVIVRTNENKQYRKWLSDISLIDEGVNTDRVEKEYDDRRAELEKEYQKDLADAEERDARAEEQRDDDEEDDDEESTEEQVKTTSESRVVRVNRILHGKH